MRVVDEGSSVWGQGAFADAEDSQKGTTEDIIGRAVDDSVFCCVFRMVALVTALSGLAIDIILMATVGAVAEAYPVDCALYADRLVNCPGPGGG